MRKGSAGPCRFANTFLSPVWNRNCISNVQITFKVGWPPGRRSLHARRRRVCGSDPAALSFSLACSMLAWGRCSGPCPLLADPGKGPARPL